MMNPPVIFGLMAAFMLLGPAHSPTHAANPASHPAPATIEDRSANDVGAYTLVNGTLGYQVDDRFRFQLIVNNIFDRDVPLAAIAYNRYNSFDILGRSYLVTATASF